MIAFRELFAWMKNRRMKATNITTRNIVQGSGTSAIAVGGQESAGQKLSLYGIWVEGMTIFKSVVELEEDRAPFSRLEAVSEFDKVLVWVWCVKVGAEIVAKAILWFVFFGALWRSCT